MWLQAVCDGPGAVRGDGNSLWGWGSLEWLFTAREELYGQKLGDLLRVSAFQGSGET